MDSLKDLKENIHLIEGPKSLLKKEVVLTKRKLNKEKKNNDE